MAPCACRMFPSACGGSSGRLGRGPTVDDAACANDSYGLPLALLATLQGERIHGSLRLSYVSLRLRRVCRDDGRRLYSRWTQHRQTTPHGLSLELLATLQRRETSWLPALVVCFPPLRRVSRDDWGGAAIVVWGRSSQTTPHASPLALLGTLQRRDSKIKPIEYLVVVITSRRLVVAGELLSIRPFEKYIGRFGRCQLGQYSRIVKGVSIMAQDLYRFAPRTKRRVRLGIPKLTQCRRLTILLHEDRNPLFSITRPSYRTRMWNHFVLSLDIAKRCR